jgi:hypothetical protein
MVIEIENGVPLFPTAQEIYNAFWKYKITVASCGRRYSKSTIGNILSVESAVVNEDQNNYWISPTYALADIQFKKYITDNNKGLFKNINIAKLTLDFWNGSRLYFKSAEEPERLVSDRIDNLFVDEAKIVKERAWEVLIPALADNKNSRAFVFSTPRGKNWFHREYLKGLDKEYIEKRQQISFTRTSYENPFLDHSWLDRLKREMTDRMFRQEILAEFIDDGTVFLGVADCISDKPKQDIPYLIDFYRFQHTTWEYIINKIKEVADKYPNSDIWIDSTGVGDPIVERLYNDRLAINGYKFTNQSKNDLIQGLIMSIDRKEINYPNIPELIDELKYFDYEISPSGNIKYSAPAGLHDDGVISLALATHGLKNSASDVVIGIDLARLVDFTSISVLNRNISYSLNSFSTVKKVEKIKKLWT